MPVFVLKVSEWLAERFLWPVLATLARAVAADAVSAWVDRKRKKGAPVPTTTADTDTPESA